MKIFIKSILLLLTMLSMITGCSNDKTSEKIREYFIVRYDGLNADNFYEHLDEMSIYYSDELKHSGAWVVDKQTNDETFIMMKEFGITSNLLYQNIECTGEDKYSADVIVKYSSANEDGTFCIEYAFEILCKDGYIQSVYKVDSNSTVTGNKNVEIKNGKLIIQESNDE